MRYPAPPSDEIIRLNLATDDGQTRAILTFEGRVEERRLARAAELSLAAEPALSCRFVDRSWRSYWEWRDSADAVFGRLDDSDCSDGLFQFMAEPDNPERAPQVRVRLRRTGRDTVCVKLSHLVADGTGALDYLASLARIYRALGADAGYSAQPDLSVSRHPAQVLRYAPVSDLIGALFRRPAPRHLARWGLPRNGQAQPPAFLVRRIGSDRLAALLSCARARGASLTDLMLAAYFRALFHVLEPPADVPLPVAVPMSLRRYLPPGRARRISNLTGALLPAVARKPGKGFYVTLADVQAALRSARAGRPELAQVFYGSLAWLCGSAVLRGLARRFHVACPSFANLGVIDPAVVDFGEARVDDVCMFGPVQYPPAFGISINTYGRELIVTTGTSSQAIAQELLDRFVDELPA